jgi:3-dehydroquinate dehydratase-1
VEREEMAENSLSICVAVPVTSTETAIVLAKKAVNERAQFIEFRVDYASDIGNWKKDQFRELVESVSVPVILTMRIQSEGGQQDIDEKIRIEILKRCIQARPTYIDLEVRMNKESLQDLYQQSLQYGVGRLYSLHDSNTTPTIVQAETLLNQIKSRCPGLISGESPDSVIKLIFFARTHRDNLVALEICRTMAHIQQKGICFCMGEKGIYSRVMCLKFGSLFSYASIGQATAPGQINIKQFYSLLSEYSAETNIQKDEKKN